MYFILVGMNFVRNWIRFLIKKNIYLFSFVCLFGSEISQVQDVYRLCLRRYYRICCVEFKPPWWMYCSYFFTSNHIWFKYTVTFHIIVLVMWEVGRQIWKILILYRITWISKHVTYYLYFYNCNKPRPPPHYIISYWSLWKC